jgi:hypothetical protein
MRCVIASSTPPTRTQVDGIGGQAGPTPDRSHGSYDTRGCCIPGKRAPGCRGVSGLLDFGAQCARPRRAAWRTELGCDSTHRVRVLAPRPLSEGTTRSVSQPWAGAGIPRSVMSISKEIPRERARSVRAETRSASRLSTTLVSCCSSEISSWSRPSDCRLAINSA